MDGLALKIHPIYHIHNVVSIFNSGAVDKTPKSAHNIYKLIYITTPGLLLLADQHLGSALEVSKGRAIDHRPTFGIQEAIDHRPTFGIQEAITKNVSPENVGSSDDGGKSSHIMLVGLFSEFLHHLASPTANGPMSILES
ncbi:unnamed protein product [Calypogeia fissa]